MEAESSHAPVSRVGRRDAKTVPTRVRLLVVLGTVAVMLLLAVLPAGSNASPGRYEWDESAGRERFVFDPPPLMLWGRVIGQMSVMLLLVSLLVAYDRPLGRVVRPRWRRRVHVTLGVLILSLAAAHAVMLPLVSVFRGWLSGVVALVALAAHGLTGARRGAIVRRHGAARWQFAHRATGWMGLAFALEHTLLFGQHLGLLRELVYG